MLAAKRVEIEARELLHLTTIAIVPHSKETVRRQWFNQLRKNAKLRRVSRAPAPEIIRQDPAAAKEWFRAQGVLVD